MIDAITTNETRFYREPRQFEFLVQRVFPRWQAEAERGAAPQKNADLERRMFVGGRAVHRGHAACPASSGGGRLGRAASSYGHFQSRAGKGAQGDLSHGEGGGVA